METFAALCGIGVERIVSNELAKLGLKAIDSRYGKVRFQADTRGLYRALIGLRTADRVLLEAATFSAFNFDDLFEGIRGIPWENFIPPSMGVRIDKVRISGRGASSKGGGNSQGPRENSPQGSPGKKGAQLQGIPSIQALANKAVAERLCEKHQRSRLPDYPAADIRIHIDGDQVEVMLDCSGEPLFKRGYRTQGGIAPLRETAAAALLFLANWRRKYPLYDPFCGAGTIAIEAAMYAWDMAPGLGRSFAISALAFGDSGAEALVRREFAERVDFSRTIRIYGSDEDPNIIRAAKANAQRAYRLGGQNAEPEGDPPGLELRTLSMRELRPISEDAGFIVTNPPYGKRLGDLSAAEELYREMYGLTDYFPGWKLGVITDHPGFESHFGRKADSCRELTNGAIQSFFYQYQKL